MIEVILPASVAAKLRRELRRAGDREIGGVLAGEDLGGGRFSVADISVQRSGGSAAQFVRDPSAHRKFMRRFLARMGNDYTRFNYLGEWHSHPRFPALPSDTDLRQMQALIEERGQPANFLVLLVVKLGRGGEIEATAHAFRRGAHLVKARLTREEGEEVLAPKAPRERLSGVWMPWRQKAAKWLETRSNHRWKTMTRTAPLAAAPATAPMPTGEHIRVRLVEARWVFGRQLAWIDAAVVKVLQRWTLPATRKEQTDGFD